MLTGLLFKVNKVSSHSFSNSHSNFRLNKPLPSSNSLKYSRARIYQRSAPTRLTIVVYKRSTEVVKISDLIRFNRNRNHSLMCNPSRKWVNLRGLHHRLNSSHLFTYSTKTGN